MRERYEFLCQHQHADTKAIENIAFLHVLRVVVDPRDEVLDLLDERGGHSDLDI